MYYLKKTISAFCILVFLCTPSYLSWESLLDGGNCRLYSTLNYALPSAQPLQGSPPHRARKPELLYSVPSAGLTPPVQNGLALFLFGTKENWQRLEADKPWHSSEFRAAGPVPLVQLVSWILVPPRKSSLSICDTSPAPLVPASITCLQYCMSSLPESHPAGVT